MKVIFQTCCGVDVQNSFLVATIIKTSNGIEPSYQKRRFSTFNNSILELKKWLLENECLYVCMESTGKYWIPVFNLLEDEINVTIANPKWVKAVKCNNVRLTHQPAVECFPHKQLCREAFQIFYF